MLITNISLNLPKLVKVFKSLSQNLKIIGFSSYRVLLLLIHSLFKEQCKNPRNLVKPRSRVFCLFSAFRIMYSPLASFGRFCGIDKIYILKNLGQTIFCMIKPNLSLLSGPLSAVIGTDAHYTARKMSLFYKKFFSNSH